MLFRVQNIEVIKIKYICFIYYYFKNILYNNIYNVKLLNATHEFKYHNIIMYSISENNVH